MSFPHNGAFEKAPVSFKERHWSNWLHSLSRAHFSLAKYIARLFWIMSLQTIHCIETELEMLRTLWDVHLWFSCPIRIS